MQRDLGWRTDGVVLAFVCTTIGLTKRATLDLLQVARLLLMAAQVEVVQVELLSTWVQVLSIARLLQGAGAIHCQSNLAQSCLLLPSPFIQ